jgi:hypothetical protein
MISRVIFVQSEYIQIECFRVLFKLNVFSFNGMALSAGDDAGISIQTRASLVLYHEIIYLTPDSNFKS